MDHAMPLPVAKAQLEQAMRDYQVAYDAALGCDRIGDRLAVSQILTSLKYIERAGLTDGGRRSLRTAIEACRTMLGVEE